MSPEVRWVVQNNLGSADDIEKMRLHLDRLGVPWTPLHGHPLRRHAARRARPRGG
jgi:hypothetical protein